VKGMRIGVPKEYRRPGMAAEIEALWQQGAQWFKDAGAELVDISLPMTKYALPAYYIVAPAEASSNLARYDGVRYGLRAGSRDVIDMYERTRAAGFAEDITLAVTPPPPAVGLPPGVTAAVKPIAKGENLTVSSALFADLVPGTGAVSISVGASTALDAASLLAALDRYPFRCSEQITSRAMPLLYVSELAKGTLMATDPTTDRRISEAIEMLLTRQDSTGSFGLWGVGGADVWLNAYVMDFLTRARERKVAVPDTAFKLGLNRLRNDVANTTDSGKNGGTDLAYALYVLARNGLAPIGDLRYLADSKLDALSTPIAKAQIAAALAMVGAWRGAPAKALHGDRISMSRESGMFMCSRSLATCSTNA